MKRGYAYSISTSKVFFYIVIAMFAIAISCCKAPQTIIKTQVKDSIVTQVKTVVKDSLIFLPGDSVTLVDTLPCPELKQSATADKGSIKTSYNISNGKLTINCKTDSLLKRISWLENQYYSTKTHQIKEVIEVPVDKPVPYIPKWVWFSLLLNLLVLLYLLWRFKNSFSFFKSNN